LLQPSALQTVSVGQSRQPPEPLQVPSAPQVLGSLLLQGALGSATPLSTKEQVPASCGLLVVPLQVLHDSEQAKSQHTFSVHIPLLHWLAAVHETPSSLRPQEFPVQAAGEIQSALLVQVDLHAPELQMKFPQARLAGVLQVPLPSHVEAGTAVEVPAQAAALQLMPLSTNAQAPPKQFPVVPQVLGRVATHLPCGSGALSAT
jgi:hypothetical protein